MEQKLNKVGAPYGSPAVRSRYISSHSYQENHDTSAASAPRWTRCRVRSGSVPFAALCLLVREGLTGLAGFVVCERTQRPCQVAVPHGVGGTVRSCFEGTVGLHKRAVLPIASPPPASIFARRNVPSHSHSLRKSGAAAPVRLLVAAFALTLNCRRRKER